MLTVYTNYLRALVGDRKGVTALEYGLIAAAICVVIATVVSGLGSAISSKFVSVSSSIAG